MEDFKNWGVIIVTLCSTMNPVIVGATNPAIQAIPLANPTIIHAYFGAKSKKLILQTINHNYFSIHFGVRLMLRTCTMNTPKPPVKL